jgi:hypothetical protein
MKPLKIVRSVYAVFLLAILNNAALAATDVVQSSGIGNSISTTPSSQAQASLTGISEASGPTNGRKSITLNGSNFLGVSTIYFGDVKADTFSINGAGTQITVTTPPNKAGQVSVIVNKGTKSASGSIQYTYINPFPTRGTVILTTKIKQVGREDRWLNNAENASGAWHHVDVQNYADNFDLLARGDGSFLIRKAGTNWCVTRGDWNAGARMLPLDSIACDYTSVRQGWITEASYEYPGAFFIRSANNYEGKPTCIYGNANGTLFNLEYNIQWWMAQHMSCTDSRVKPWVLTADYVPQASAVSFMTGSSNTLIGASQVSFMTRSSNTLIGAPQIDTQSVVSSQSTSVGYTSGGSQITFGGVYLDGTTQVLIGGKPGTNLNINPEGTRLKVTTPAGSVGRVDITFKNRRGDVTLKEAFQYAEPPLQSGQVVARAYLSTDGKYLNNNQNKSGAWHHFDTRAKAEKFEIVFVRDGAFLMRKAGTKWCVKRGYYNGGQWVIPLDSMLCDSQSDDQLWALEPVRGSSENGNVSYSKFYIKSPKLFNSTDITCMIADGNGPWGVMQHVNCERAAANSGSVASSKYSLSRQIKWVFEYDGLSAADGNSKMTALAGTFAMSECRKDKNKCVMNNVTVVGERTGQPVCLLSVHATNAPLEPALLAITYASSYAYMVSDTVATGYKVGFKLDISKKDAFVAGFNAEVNQTFTRQVTDTYSILKQEMQTFKTPALSPGEYGWIVAEPVIKSYKGSFKFNPGAWNEFSFADNSILTAPSSVTVASGSTSDSSVMNSCNGYPDGDPLDALLSK